jgi:hypothetical protein
MWRMAKTSGRKRTGMALWGAIAMAVAVAAPDRARAEDQDAGLGRRHPPKITSFSVGSDEQLIYPTDLTNLPDEHTSVLPPAPGSNKYLFFSASSILGGSGGAVALETWDLKNFTFSGGYPPQVMTPPINFKSCDPSYNFEFDENYAAPGSVVQDPTLPPGNLIMIYEAENHCPGGANAVNQHSLYGTVGFARSSDNGKTWPSPVNSPFGGKDRYPVLKGPVPEPAGPFDGAMGNAIPSAFMDGEYLYVVYGHFAGAQSDGLLRVARAKLGVREDGQERRGAGAPTSQLSFLKWHNGAFTEPGVGGLDSGVVPAFGCVGNQGMGAIHYNDDLGLYLITFVCDTFAEDGHGAWYYSTATSLDRQDWSVPEMIRNSKFAITRPCNPNNDTGSSFDGFYPSFMSPESTAGHTKKVGRVFFLNGCDTGLPRAFASRTFEINAESERDDR